MAEGTTLLDEVSVTTARKMRQYYDNVVHGKRPLLMTRHHEPGAVVMPREDLALMLRRYRFTLDVLPEDDGSFTLWVPELGVGASGTRAGAVAATVPGAGALVLSPSLAARPAGTSTTTCRSQPHSATTHRRTD